MSVQGRKHLSAYTGSNRYTGWIRDYLELQLSPEQQAIAEALLENRKVCVMGANGFGKTWIIAALSLAFLFRNYPANVLATSGNFAKMRRTYCSNVEELHAVGSEYGLPGQYLISKSRIKFATDKSIGWEASVPRDVEELEGLHNTFLMGIIEEGDKSAVTHDTVESMESLLTDRRDRLVMTCNPPKDEMNVVADIIGDPTWKVLTFSSFDSHNVQVDLGNRSGPKIDGLLDLSEIRESWISWNNEPWPGIDGAMKSGDRDDLSSAWYRRRLGVVPPSAASVFRPFSVTDVREAFSRMPATVTKNPDAVGIDVARGTSGDKTAVVGVFGDDLRVLGYWNAKDHLLNEDKIRRLVGHEWSCPVAMDAIGEGSALADNVESWYPGLERFHAGARPADNENYLRKWDQGLAELGHFLREGGSIDNATLREELFAAARVVEFERRYRGAVNSDVLRATSKGSVTDILGHSPDLLDAAYQAVYSLRASETGHYGNSWAW